MCELDLELSLDSYSGAPRGPRASPGPLLGLQSKVTNFMKQGSSIVENIVPCCLCRKHRHNDAGRLEMLVVPLIGSRVRVWWTEEEGEEACGGLVGASSQLNAAPAAACTPPWPTTTILRRPTTWSHRAQPFPGVFARKCTH